MANSIVKLSLEATQYNNGLKEAKKSWNDFMKALGLSTKSLSAVGVAAGAASAAMKILKDSFESSREMVDEWGRTMQSAEALYNGFVRSLNNSDFSGFINNMANIAGAARDAYDAVSNLQLLNSWNAGNMQSARTGFTGAVADFRNGNGSKDDVKAAAENLKNQLKERKKAELDALASTLSSEAQIWGLTSEDLSKALRENFDEFMNRTHAYVTQESYSKQTVAPLFGPATVAGAMSGRNYNTRITHTPGTTEEKLSDFARRITPESIDKLRKYEVMAQSTEEEIRNIDKQVARILGKTGRPGSGGRGGNNNTKGEKDGFQEMEEIVGLIPVAEQKVKDLKQQIRESWDEGEIARLTEQLKVAEAELQRLQDIGKEVSFVKGLSGFNANTMAAWMQGRQGDLSKADYGSSDYSGILANIADMTSIKTILEESMKAGIDAAQLDLEPLWEKVFDGENIKDSVWQGLVDTINEKLATLGIDPINIDFNTGTLANANKEAKESKKNFSAAAAAISRAGSAMQSIEDPSVKIMGMIGQAIASIALGFATASSKEGKGGIWYWIAATAAGLATMIATISSIHNATGYANGGIVGGNSYSGDNVYAGNAWVNSGELILNKAQQNSIADQLTGNGGPIRVIGKIRGSDIILSADRALQESGRGQLLTWG